jgi:hypothetical protein
MPKQGGQGKGKPKLRDRGFGKSLMKNQAHGSQGLYVSPAQLLISFITHYHPLFL